MNTHHFFIFIAAFTHGCGTTPSSVEPRQEAFVDGFPAEPYPQQKRPGPDGRCSSRRGPPHIIVKGGGCWAWVEMEIAECEKAHKEGDYYVPYQGRCYYPLFILKPQREPTSSL